MKLKVSEILPCETNHYTEYMNSFIPSEAFISLKQDDSEETIPVIKIGDTVTEGQILASGKKVHGSIVHSSIPGIIENIEYKTTPDGKKTKTIKIKMHGEFSYFNKTKKNIAWQSFPPATLRRIIAENGIINTFDKPYPLSLKLDYYSDKNSVPAIIVRMFDLDPSCTIDRFIAENYCKQVIEGACIIAAAIGSSDIIIVYPENFTISNDDKENLPEFISHFVDTSKYPCGETKELITSINKRKNNKRKITFSDLFIDSTTAFSVYESVVFNQPIVERFVQVSGHSLMGNRIMKVRIGTPIKMLAAECGGFVKNPEKIVINGLLYGTNVTDLDIPITKYVKSVIFMPKKELMNQKESECIQCGNCRSVCPEDLLPDILYSIYKKNYVYEKDFIKTIALCRDCLMCNLVCPARLPLNQTIAILKKDEKGSNNE